MAGHAFSSVSTAKEICRVQTSVYYIFVARVVGREGAAEEVRSRESAEGDCGFKALKNSFQSLDTVITVSAGLRVRTITPVMKF